MPRDCRIRAGLRASFSQSVQPPLSALVSLAGAFVIEPRLEASVIEAFCKKTTIALVYRDPLTLSEPHTMETGYGELAVPRFMIQVRYLQSVTSWTPCAASHVCRGSTSESY